MIRKEAKRILLIEAEAIRAAAAGIGKGFEKAVNFVSGCRGKVVVTGMGKSGLIARKISATLSSTGTPSFFLHPSEALLGDVGMVEKGDLVLALSFSGESREITDLLPYFGRLGVKVIGMTGKANSTLASKSDACILFRIRREACSSDIVPTASSTAMLALGDALALCVMKKKSFGREKFASFHPGGMLGKKLLLKVKDIMRRGKENPLIREDKTVRDALYVMTATRMGATSVVDRSGRLAGFFTDGDLRRCMRKGEKILERKIGDIMTKKPVTVKGDTLALDAARLIKEKKIDNMPVLDENRRPVGILDERDLLSEGFYEEEN